MLQQRVDVAVQDPPSVFAADDPRMSITQQEQALAKSVKKQQSGKLIAFFMPFQ